MRIETRLEEQGDAFMHMLGQTLDKAVAEGALVMAGEIKTRTPVRTGRLRASITASSALLDGSDMTGEAHVGTNVEYAAHVEYGTIRQRPQPYMRTGGEASRGKVESILVRRLKRLGLGVEVVSNDR